MRRCVMNLIYIFVWTATALIVGAGALFIGFIALGTAWAFVRELANLVWAVCREVSQPTVEKPLPKPTNPRGLSIDQNWLK